MMISYRVVLLIFRSREPIVDDDFAYLLDLIELSFRSSWLKIQDLLNSNLLRNFECRVGDGCT